MYSNTQQPLGVDWPTTPDELRALQCRLGAARPAPARLPPPAERTIAACFVCFGKRRPGGGERGEAAWAAAVLVRRHRVVHESTVGGVAGSRYEAGLLALREGPLLERVVHSLPATPDVLLVNASGRDHPRRAGLALHLGAVLGVPSVGVTDRPLCAEGAVPGETRWDSSALELDGEVVGAWLRTRAGARPVAVHAGWRTEADLAVDLVRRCTRRARTPEPLRRARRAARLARAFDQARVQSAPEV